METKDQELSEEGKEELENIGKEERKEERNQGINLDAELKINKYKLDDECENQPNLYNYYATQLADMKTEKGILKNRLKFFSSKIELDILSTTNEKGITPGGVKITISSMNALLTTHETIVKINDELVQVERAIYHLEAAVESFQQRRSDLDNLVKLYGNNYFSLPGGMRKDGNSEVSKAIRKKLNKEER